MNKRIAIVTGSSTGIGKATVLHLSRKGFLVFAGIRRESDAEQFQSLKGIFPLLLDVSSQDSVEKAVEIAAEKLNTASEVHLINNAGIVVAGPVEGVSLTRWKEQFEVNFFGLLRVTQTLLPYIRKTRGRIVNISSISGLAAFPYLGPYCASKFAVEALSDALRRELRQFGCSVVVIEPGPINTPIWEKNLKKKDELITALSSEQRELYGKELNQFQLGVEQSSKDAVSVEEVTRAIEKALTSTRPRTRYIVGSKVLATQMALAKILPDTWLDLMVAQRFRGE